MKARKPYHPNYWKIYKMSIGQLIALDAALSLLALKNQVVESLYRAGRRAVFEAHWVGR